jgi:hypothetical protein
MADYGCKVCRVLDERGMERYESRLVEQWQEEGSQRKGYRQLATWLNVTTLRREMDQAGLSTLGDEARSKYERLTGDDETVAAEVRNSLRTRGVPVDAVEDDFVSYGVVRKHLKECLGEDRAFEGGDWEADAIDIARDHAQSKVEAAVGSLVRKGDIEAVGDVAVHVDVELECTETHVRVPLDRALRRGYVSEPNDGVAEDGTERAESGHQD